MNLICSVRPMPSGNWGKYTILNKTRNRELWLHWLCWTDSLSIWYKYIMQSSSRRTWCHVFSSRSRLKRWHTRNHLSQFFSKKVSLHSIKIGLQPRVVYDRIIDENCGHSFSSVLADLDGLTSETTSLPQVVDSGSTVDTLSKGDAFSHLLVTSHECSYARKSR